MDKIENLVCIFYDMEEDPTVENLQKIAGGCQENNIGIVKINDASEAEKYGLKDQPIAMFIHKGIPSLMVGNIEDPDEVGLSYYKIETLKELYSNSILGSGVDFETTERGSDRRSHRWNTHRTCRVRLYFLYG